MEGVPTSDAGYAATVMAAYLCGALPTGLWMARSAGIDIRAAGSGNIGATNVARVLGLRAGLITLVADALKGLVPVLAARTFGASDPLLAAMSAAAVLGHLYPVFAGFRGGKGVATTAGCFLAMDPAALGAALVSFGIVAGMSRIVSLASLAGAWTLAPAAWLLGRNPWEVGLAVLAAALVTWKHRDNLRRLRAGTEPRFRAGRHRS